MLAAEIAALVVVVTIALAVDMKVMARGAVPTFRVAAVWSAGWFALSLAVAPVMGVVEGSSAAIDYTTVYLIERTLSLDNLFVFLLLFAYFGVPPERRPGLLFYGIAMALVLRGLAILSGVALIERFHFVVYVLGATLLVLAVRMWRGVGEETDPDRTFAVRMARRIKGDASPITLALLSMVFADIAFAVDSIPAAFAITTDAFVIWTANAFALLGMRALFVLVEGLIARFRYLTQTVAIVLGVVAVKLLTEEWVHVGPLASLAIVAATFAAGIAASLLADRRDARAERLPPT